jgi:site-specific DNA-methyltransferase (adenine-specific)
MGKQWDKGVPGVELWREVLRVLKPGGHLLAFAGTRTQHRMATAIEDAGFEIRDMIAWVYGSGFPKSLDVSKAIDKAAGAEREVVGSANVPDMRSGNYENATGRMIANITAPATEAAQQWAGWGTALKPSLEPITVARKPLCGTVAANVLEHGTGGLNVDGCRVGTSKNVPASVSRHKVANTYNGGWNTGETPGVGGHDPNLGRWPANLIHDGSEEVVGLFPDDGDASAARFFYCAKADASERRQSKHPTIKPVALMRYLVRLVTPPGGLVLDPFGGSGTTAEAARLEHCRYLLMELSPEYCADAAERLRQGVLF